MIVLVSIIFVKKLITPIIDNDDDDFYIFELF